MEITFNVRDLRDKHFFVIDDAYLNGYAKFLGTTTTCVYISLCRHADKNQTCFPSEKLMGEELGVKERTVRRSVRVLRDWRIIGIKQKKSKSGKFLHNEYCLYDKSVWRNKPKDTNVPRTPKDTRDLYRRTFDDKTVGHQSPHKDTHIKDTHIRIDNLEKYKPDFLKRDEIN